MTNRIHHDDEPGVVTLADELLTTLWSFEDFSRSMDTIAITIENSVTVLDQFVVEGQVVKNGPYYILANATAHFTKATYAEFIRAALDDAGAAVDPTALGATGKALIVIDCRGFYGIRIRAARATGSASVLTIKTGGD